MKNKNRIVLSFFGALVLVLSAALNTSACPNCRNSQPDSDDPGLALRLSQAYLWSYVAMTSMPFLTVGTFFGAAIYLRRKKLNSSKS